MATTTIELIAVDALKPNPRNARTHSKRQVQQIADSIGVRLSCARPDRRGSRHRRRPRPVRGRQAARPQGGPRDPRHGTLRRQAARAGARGQQDRRQCRIGTGRSWRPSCPSLRRSWWWRASTSRSPASRRSRSIRSSSTSRRTQLIPPTKSILTGSTPSPVSKRGDLWNWAIIVFCAATHATRMISIV